MHTLSLTPGQIQFYTEHALRQVITATQSGTWTPTRPQTHPGNRGLAVCQTGPAQTGCLVRHTALSSRAVGVLRPRTWWTAKAFPPRKRSYCHRRRRPLPNQSLRRPRPPSPGGLHSPCLHLPVPRRSPRSLFACSQSSMTLTTMRFQRRAQGPQPA